MCLLFLSGNSVRALRRNRMLKYLAVLLIGGVVAALGGEADSVESYPAVYVERLVESSAEFKNVDALFLESDYLQDCLPKNPESYYVKRFHRESREWYKVPLPSRLAKSLPGTSLYLVVGHEPDYWHCFFALRARGLYTLPGGSIRLLSDCGTEFTTSDAPEWIRVLVFLLIGNGEFQFEAYRLFEFSEPVQFHGPFSENPKARREAILRGDEPLSPAYTIDSVVTNVAPDALGWWTVKVGLHVGAVPHLLEIVSTRFVGDVVLPLFVRDSKGRYGYFYWGQR